MRNTESDAAGAAKNARERARESQRSGRAQSIYEARHGMRQEDRRATEYLAYLAIRSLEAQQNAIDNPQRFTTGSTEVTLSNKRVPGSGVKRLFGAPKDFGRLTNEHRQSKAVFQYQSATNRDEAVANARGTNKMDVE